MRDDLDVAVIGAGHAGLSLSYELSRAGIEHVILERGRIGGSWRGRWDSFCLVTPNWTVRLPGYEYRGDDPDGFMARDEIVEHLVGYAEEIGAPVSEGISVAALESGGVGFLLRTSSGDLHARDVVVASGAYQKPHRPAGADQLPRSLHVIDAEGYTNPDAIPSGKVLIVGSGQTGCQLAEDLVEAGRDVSVACGRAPWMHRRLGDRDLVAWVVETPFMEMTLADLPHPSARLIANVQASGRGGGHDLHYRTLQTMGVELFGHLEGVEDGVAHFAADLAESVAFGDARYLDLRAMIERACAERGVTVPEIPPPEPFVADEREHLALDGFGTAIFTSGFRPDYTSWIRFPAAFDELGFPIQRDGTSTVVPGLHFMGVHFQRKRKSATFWGVGEDAAVLAETIRGR
jgi:putative flavoprotein involved in K+ transport